MKDNDLFAFPVPSDIIKKTIDDDGNESTIFRNGYNGMTLRDYFAGRALTGQITFEGMEGCNPELISGCAYELADAMLAEREKKGRLKA